MNGEAEVAPAVVCLKVGGIMYRDEVAARVWEK